MSIVKRIYCSPLGVLISILQHCIAVFKRPMMIYGYYNKPTRTFLKGVRISTSAVITDKNKLVIGDNVWINHYARIDASGGVAIGEGCQIGYSSMILSHSSHNAIRLNGKQYIWMDICDRKGYIHKPVTIGSYTFIGGGACIMPGVRIGKGCVIGVNSVVTHDIPDYSVAVGTPARVTGSTKDIDKYYVDNPDIERNYYEPKNLQSLKA